MILALSRKVASSVKLVSNDNGTVSVELTRRNLVALLQKLDAEGETSATLYKPGAGDNSLLFVKAVEDEEHYLLRPAGLMQNPDTKEIW